MILIDTRVLPAILDGPELIAEALALPDSDGGRKWLRDRCGSLRPSLADDLATALKAQADYYLRADLQRSSVSAELLLLLAETTSNSLYRALGLRALANVKNIGQREFGQALALYDEAAAIYRDQHLTALEAEALVGKVAVLALLGRYEEAFQTADWASQVLEQNARWRQLVTLMLNMGVIYNRLNDDVQALRMFDQARIANQRLGAAGQTTLLMIENNRAIHLRNLGQFQAALQAGDTAYTLAMKLGYAAESARVQNNQAYVHIALGRYNDALQLLDHARDILAQDGRTRDALMVDLDMIDCWLQLGRYDKVLDTCRQARQLLAASEAPQEMAQAVLSAGVAYAGLHRYPESLASIAEAAGLFERTGNSLWAASARLEAASVHYQQGTYADSLEVAQRCAEVFRSYPAPIRYAQACLVAARSATAVHLNDQALHYIDEAQRSVRDIPALEYQAHYLRGTLAESTGDMEGALGEYDRAIEQVERMRGRMMVEFRSSFVADKQAVFEDAVRACVALDQPEMALGFAERAKSRALLDLLTHRLDVSIRPRTAADQPRVDQLNALRSERDRLYRRWESERDGVRENAVEVSDERLQAAHHAILSVERQITDLWHALLVRNADYARDAAQAATPEANLWQAPPEPIKPYLDEGTLLLEYFVAGGQLYAFLVTRATIEVRLLPAHLADVGQWQQKLHLNFRAVAAAPGRGVALQPNARGILGHLHQLLLAPLQDAIARHERLLIVPHGSLHHLPFHALHDGTSYLIERLPVGYLPSAGMLRFCREPRARTNEVVALGCSDGGRLAGAPDEARAVAAQLGGRAFMESEATLGQMRQAALSCRLMHLATHAQFRQDNPLFSYLVLYDGQLTALDVFNMQMNASLVTLSACETGESAVGGGDELHGLARAFLYAGAASLAVSGWPVEDRCTAVMMQSFYSGLASGEDKIAALRNAQLPLIVGRSANYAHPHYWASFSLIGDWGRL